MTIGFLLNFNEARLLGVLIEKSQTTPDLMPLTLNSCVLGCNQTSNRHPIVQLSESEAQEALESLMAKKLVVRVHGVGARTVKYNHICENHWALKREDLSIVSILLLRGDQTPGDLSTRSKRACPDLSLNGVLDILENLSNRDTPFVCKLQRQPGQKEARWRCLLAAANEIERTNENTKTTENSSEDHLGFRDEIQFLRDEVQDLRDEVLDLKNELRELKAQLN
jgi:uncharacterized protein